MFWKKNCDNFDSNWFLTELKFLIQKNLVIGASGAFINGQTIVCGGATEKYLHCNTINGEGNLKCDRNVDCVTSLGGSKWCSGPKIDECYSYDSVFTQVKNPLIYGTLFYNRDS